MAQAKINTTLKSNYQFDFQYEERKQGLLHRYLNYCDQQVDKGLFWYMASLSVVSCVVMPIAFFVMYISGGLPLWFAATSMLLLVTNMLMNVAEMHPRWTISFFILTSFVLTAIPLFSLISNGITLWP